MIRAVFALTIVLAAAAPAAADGQAAAPQSPSAPAASVGAALKIERTAESFSLFFFNRPIVVLRARVAGRGPAERALGASRLLGDLVAQRRTGRVEALPFDGGALIRVGEQAVFAVTAADLDNLAGETLAGVTPQVVARLQRALDEAAEAREPGLLLREAGIASAAIVGAVLALWAVARGRRRIAVRLIAAAERRIAAAGLAPLEALRSSRALNLERHVVQIVFTTINLVILYTTGTFVLRQFPYTRPWGDSMRRFLLITVEALGLQVFTRWPGLFTVALIVGVVLSWSG